VLDGAGEIVATGPGTLGPAAAEAAVALWAAAVRCAGRADLDHMVVPAPDGAVAIVQAHGRRIVALTGPRPAVALLLFDLRTCLGDAYATLEEIV
jgi:hypothetical protein